MSHLSPLRVICDFNKLRNYSKREFFSLSEKNDFERSGCDVLRHIELLAHHQAESVVFDFPGQFFKFTLQENRNTNAERYQLTFPRVPVPG